MYVWLHYWMCHLLLHSQHFARNFLLGEAFDTKVSIIKITVRRDTQQIAVDDDLVFGCQTWNWRSVGSTGSVSRKHWFQNLSWFLTSLLSRNLLSSRANASKHSSKRKECDEVARFYASSRAKVIYNMYSLTCNSNQPLLQDIRRKQVLKCVVLKRDFGASFFSNFSHQTKLPKLQLEPKINQDSNFNPNS